MDVLLLTIAGTVIAAAIIGAANWLRHGPNRDVARDAVRQRFCRHRREPINEPGDEVVLVGSGSEWVREMRRPPLTAVSGAAR